MDVEYQWKYNKSSTARLQFVRTHHAMEIQWVFVIALQNEACEATQKRDPDYEIHLDHYH